MRATSCSRIACAKAVRSPGGTSRSQAGEAISGIPPTLLATKGIPLAIATATLLEQSPKGDNLIYLNRLLLQDAYPLELSRSQRKDCVNCHNPHSPPFPSRPPAPGPHPLREIGPLAGPQTAQE